MIGLILAVFWSAWQYFYHGASVAVLWASAWNFLFYWYLAFAVLVALLYLVLSLLMALGFGASAFEKLGPVGALMGAFGGGCLGLAALGVLWVVNYGALIWATLLMQGALVNGAWKPVNLILGGILLVIGLASGRARLSSSSKSS